MFSIEKIDSALTFHKHWKTHLQEVVQTGISDFTVADARSDRACDFGKWIYKVWDNEKDNPDFIKIKRMHAEFHKAAAEILELAVSGKKDEAGKKLEKGESFDKISEELISALNDIYFAKQKYFL